MEYFIDYQQLYSSSLSSDTRQSFTRYYGPSSFWEEPENPDNKESLKSDDNQKKVYTQEPKLLAPTPPLPKKEEGPTRYREPFLPPLPRKVTMDDIYKANGQRALTYFERNEALKFEVSLLWAIRDNPSWLIRLGLSMDSLNPDSGFKKLMTALKKAEDPNEVLRKFVDN